MVYTLKMWIILGLFISLSALALEPFERIQNVKILRVLPQNILMLDRGIEDGILKNDHIKLSTESEGYTARAICIRAAATTSFWKLYRLPNAEAISMDISYIITGYADREIPLDEEKNRDYEHEIAEPTKKTDPGPNPFLVKRDLPEKLTERDLIDSVGPDKQKLWVERALDHDQFKRDIKDYRFSIFASPFVRQSINQSESYRYGFRGGNVASKYRLMTNFEQQQSRMRDPVSHEAVSYRSTNGQAQFVIHRLKPWLSSLSLINYNSTRFTAVATPKHHWQVGPIGFTWHMYESKTWEYLDLSYIPLYDMRKTEVMQPDGHIAITDTNGLRHGFRTALRTKINERVSLENVLWVKPFQDLASWAIETNNLNLSNDLKMIFNISENLFFDYNLIYQKDRLWKTLNNLPETNIINSVNFRYDFNI